MTKRILVILCAAVLTLAAPVGVSAGPEYDQDYIVFER